MYVCSSVYESRRTAMLRCSRWVDAHFDHDHNLMVTSMLIDSIVVANPLQFHDGQEQHDSCRAHNLRTQVEINRQSPYRYICQGLLEEVSLLAKRSIESVRFSMENAGGPTPWCWPTLALNRGHLPSWTTPRGASAPNGRRTWQECPLMDNIG